MAGNKYGARKTIVDGITFDSKREAIRYQELKLLERAGEIKDLELQPKYILQPKYRKNGKSIREIAYIADFRYFDTRHNKLVVEDVKGVKTEVYRLKKKIAEYVYTELEIKEV